MKTLFTLILALFCLNSFGQGYVNMRQSINKAASNEITCSNLKYAGTSPSWSVQVEVYDLANGYFKIEVKDIQASQYVPFDCDSLIVTNMLKVNGSGIWRTGRIGSVPVMNVRVCYHPGVDTVGTYDIFETASW